jgi:hypothetical protein
MRVWNEICSQRFGFTRRFLSTRSGRSAKQVNVYWRQILVLDYCACQASQPSFRH